ncbi:MAG: NAD-dependent epimerase/dehydratase family protein [Paludibacteraceae bacterium]|nr:NAD-dependent epimerase/dehydratase family protein [Paludibacteraceae bacterium]
MTKVLITGATGYIGRQLVKQITEQEPQASILTLNRDIQKAQVLMPYKQCIHKDVYDQASIHDFSPDLVIHLATLSTSRADSEIITPMLNANINYGVWLLNELSQIKTSNPITFVNVGSFAEYRMGVSNGFRPAYLYSATKTAFRHILTYYQDTIPLKVITAVLYTVYGGKDTQKKLIDYILESVTSEKPVDMTQGEQVLDFIHLSDVVQFFVNIVKSPQALAEGEYHIGTSKGTNIRAVADTIQQIIGRPLNIHWGGRDYRPLDVMSAIAPQNKELEKFWKPKVSLTQGILSLIKDTDK